MLLKKIMTRLGKLRDISNSILQNFFVQSSLLYDTRTHVKIFKDNINYVEPEIEDIYIKSKSILNRLNNFVKLYKWKKSVIYSAETDLFLNPIKDFRDNQKIIILENNTRYRFRLSDLINYWVTCLTNNQGLFSKPTIIKNPHTNMEISYHNLYNIYFKLLDSPFNIPLHINAFFVSNMDIELFYYDFFTLLKEDTIENFINSENVYEIFEQILNMLHDFRKDIDYLTIRMSVSLRVKHLLCKKLKKVLQYYLKSKYSCNPLIKKHSKYKTKSTLQKYLRIHPDFDLNFGTEIIKYIPVEDRPPPAPPPPPPPDPPPQTPVTRRPRLPPPAPPEFFESVNRTLTSVGVPSASPVISSINIPTESINTNNNRNVIIRNTNNTYNQLLNPFAPSRELLRTPPSNLYNRRVQMARNLRLFR